MPTDFSFLCTVADPGLFRHNGALRRIGHCLRGTNDALVESVVDDKCGRVDRLCEVFGNVGGTKKNSTPKYFTGIGAIPVDAIKDILIVLVRG